MTQLRLVVPLALDRDRQAIRDPGQIRVRGLVPAGQRQHHGKKDCYRFQDNKRGPRMCSHQLQPARPPVLGQRRVRG